MTRLYVLNRASEANQLRVVDAEDGSAIWSKDLGTTGQSVRTDPAGRVLVAHNRLSNLTTHLYDADGNQLAAVDTGRHARGACLGAGYFWVGSLYTGTNVHKFELDGTPVWSYFNVDTVTGISVDVNGAPYFAGTHYDVAASYYKMTVAGGMDWTANEDVVGYATAVDKDGNPLFAGGYNSPDGSVWKYTPEGAEDWVYKLGAASAWDVASDRGGNVYAAYVRTGTPAYSLVKLSPDGARIWGRDAGAESFAVAVDPDDNVYVGRELAAGASVLKYDGDGNLVWSLDLGAEVVSLAVDPGCIGAFPSYWPPALPPPNIYVGRVKFE